METIRAQDEILMAEHLAIHRSKIDIITMKLRHHEGEVAELLRTERRLLSDHVEAMQELLEGQEPRPVGRHGRWPAFLEDRRAQSGHRGSAPADYRYAGQEERGADSRDECEVIENVWMSRQLAIENLRSALEMDDKTAQWTHVGMALDQVELAERWADLAKREGWMPTAPASHGVTDTVERDYARPALRSSRAYDRWNR